jgi:hypothetical protein
MKMMPRENKVTYMIYLRREKDTRAKSRKQKHQNEREDAKGQGDF